MTILKNHHFAIGITLLLCLLCFLLGARNGLQRQRTALEQKYETGVDGSGYGIATDLQKRYTYAGNLVSIAQKYSGAFDTEISAVTQARNELLEAMATDGYGDDYLANSALTDAVQALNEVMKSYALSEDDASYRNEVYNNFVSRNDAISHAATDFNTQVRSFNQDILGSFPASVLHGLLGIPSVEVFG